eukprot:1392570-Amorphochlora_amoeboformis.AAC.1
MPDTYAWSSDVRSAVTGQPKAVGHVTTTESRTVLAVALSTWTCTRCTSCTNLAMRQDADFVEILLSTASYLRLLSSEIVRPTLVR